jgi:putative transposase
VREQFGLAAQVAVRCIAKVADSYKTDARGMHKFGKFAAQPYDERIFRFLDDSRVSIWTLSGRQKIDYVCGEKQRALLKYRKGEVDLTFIRDKWYLSICCDIPEPDDVETLGKSLTTNGLLTIALARIFRAAIWSAWPACPQPMH